MGLFGFGNKKQHDEEKINEVISSDYGTLAKMVYCTPIKAIEKICDAIDCPAHFALVPWPDSDATSDYPIYTLKIIAGEINAGDNFGMLQYIFSQAEDERIELLQKRFGMSEAEARNIDGIGIEYTFNDSSHTIEFSSESVMSSLKQADVNYHRKALGRIIHEQVPSAYVSSDNQKVFVMLHGNERGKYEEK